MWWDAPPDENVIDRDKMWVDFYANVTAIEATIQSSFEEENDTVAYNLLRTASELFLRLQNECNVYDSSSLIVISIVI